MSSAPFGIKILPKDRREGRTALSLCKSCGGKRRYKLHGQEWTGLCDVCEQDGWQMTCPSCDGKFRARTGFGCFCSEHCALRYDPVGVTMAANVMQAYRAECAMATPTKAGQSGDAAGRAPR